MTFLWQTAQKDLQRRIKDPIALLMWIAIPAMMLLLFTVAFGGAGSSVKPQVHLLVADQDDSFASGLLLGSFGQGEMAELFKTEAVEEEEGMRLLQDGKASALLIIPPAFGDDVLNQRETKLVLRTNPAQRILPGIAEEVLSVLVDGLFYIQQVIGTPLSSMIDQATGTTSGPTDASIASFSVTVNQLMNRVEKYVFPPVIDLDTSPEPTEATEEESSASSGNSIGELFFPGLLFMSLLFMGQGLADDIWTERAGGTLSRLLTTPHSALQIVAGKILAGVIIMGCVVGLALAAGMQVYDIDPLRAAGGLLWAVFSGFLLLSMMVLIQAYASSQRAGTVLTSLIVFPLMMVGGSFFPLEMMPEFLISIGRWTPNGWSLVIFKSILAGEAQMEALAGGFLGLGLAAICLTMLAARRLRLVNTGS